MYNQEIKERFLAESKKNESKRRYLERITSAEESVNLDICQMSRAQAIKAIESVGMSYDLGTFDTIISNVKVYAKWCFDAGLFPDEHYGIMGISATDVNPQEFIRQYIYLSEDELAKNIGELVPLYDGLIEVSACFLAWLGVDDPLSIRDEDVLLDAGKILRNNVVIVDGMSDFLRDFFARYRKLKTSTRENGTTVYTVVKDNSYDTFLKQFCSVNSKKLGKKLELRNVQTAINKLNDRNVYAGNVPRITYRNIMKSGSLARLYVAEKNGLQVFDRTNKEIVEGFFYQSDYRSIVWLYKHYKEAFNL